MSDYELRGLLRLLDEMPHSQIHWREEAIGPDLLPVHSRHAAGSPAQAADRWRALLWRCRTDRRWHVARLIILDPPA